jgi:hypothetical protein
MSLPKGTSPEALIAIEVCVGQHCLAGGAAILEIEELVQEDGSGKFQIVQGGCRNLCTVGPNVHCRSIHFSRIKGPDECLVVAATIGLQLKPSNVDGSASVVGNLLMKKANGLRWKVLREIGRRRLKGPMVKLPSCTFDEWLNGLSAAHRLEVRAASLLGLADEGIERANRRLTRLEVIIREYPCETMWP